MKNAARTTIDAAGRLVVPKSLRTRAGFVPGQVLQVSLTDDGRIEVEPWTAPARIEARGRWRVALPAEGAPPLEEASVEAVRRALREAPRGA